MLQGSPCKLLQALFEERKQIIFKMLQECWMSFCVRMQLGSKLICGMSFRNIHSLWSFIHVLTSLCRGCLLVRQSFFHSDARNYINIGGGVFGARGFHTSFKTTQRGLSLNIGNSFFKQCVIRLFFVTFWLLINTCFFRFFFSLDTSTTMVVQPGPVIDFLLANQNVNDPKYLDWNKVHHLICAA